MDQAFRGLAYTALTAGQDISERISQLYAPPGAWSHGLALGRGCRRDPARRRAFKPATTPVRRNELQGGVRRRPADWYALTLKGTAELRAVLDLLRSGVDGEVAEAAFTSATAGLMPAGSLIFPDEAATVAALEAAGRAAGIVLRARPRRHEAGGDAARRGTADRDARRQRSPAESDTSWSLRQIFGADVGFVSAASGPNSLQNAADRPAGRASTSSTTPARSSRGGEHRAGPPGAFFERGGGYIATSQSASTSRSSPGSALV